MTVNTQTWRFQALDTWFFRESRPMESIGGSELMSTFPPSPRTLSGAVRSVVGEHKQVNWKQWRDKTQYADIKRLLGDAEGFGELSFTGPWLARETGGNQTERLFPVPRNLVAILRKDDETRVGEVKRLRVGLPRQCDLGRQVRMAVTPPGYSRLHSLDDFWLPAKALESVLSGGLCEADDIVGTSLLFDREARLGIARSNQTRTVETGLLYQTRHVRPRSTIVIETDVGGLAEDDHPAEGIIRLGGEGRGAAYSTHPATIQSILNKVTAGGNTHGIILMLLTPACMEESSSFVPLPHFTCDDSGETTVWKGKLHEISLTLHCAIQGKAVREGGWDLANNKPRAVQSLIPAGSVYYLTVDNGDIQAAIDALHLKQLPANKSDLALGRGLLAVGLWSGTELMNKE